jgi:hypothetical protein
VVFAVLGCGLHSSGDCGFRIAATSGTDMAYDVVIAGGALVAGASGAQAAAMLNRALTVDLAITGALS